jgi:hypothetical protein
MMGFAAGRVGQDGACAERAWPELHPACVDRADFTCLEPARRAFDRRLGKAPDAPRSGKFSVDRGREIAPEINVTEVAALFKPVRETIACQQPGKRAADRQAVVAHRGKDVDLVEVQYLRQQPVELNISEYAS